MGHTCMFIVSSDGDKFVEPIASSHYSCTPMELVYPYMRAMILCNLRDDTDILSFSDYVPIHVLLNSTFSIKG